MSNLEIAVKPTVAAMIKDISIPLDKIQQLAISKWMTKNAMVLEYIAFPHTNKVFYSERDCAQLMLGLLPANTFIWLSRYIGNYWPIFSKGVNLWHGGFPGGGDTAEGYVYTFSVGFFGIQLVTFRVPPKRDTPIFIHTRPGPWDVSTIQIWPTSRTVQWPPSGSFGDGGYGFPSFQEFAERFSFGDHIV